MKVHIRMVKFFFIRMGRVAGKYRRNNIVCIITTLLIGLFASGWFSAVFSSERVRIAIIPFKMNGDGNLSFLQQGIVDMLTTRLSNPGKSLVISKEETQKVLNGAKKIMVNEDFAKALAAQLNADYVLFGSLNASDDRVEINAKMLDLSSMQPPMTFFEQSQGMNEVIPKIDEIAAQINQEVFGRKISEVIPKKPTAKEKPSLYAHPERLWEKELSRSSMNPDTRKEVMFQRPVAMITGFQKSRDFKFEAEGIAVGDLNGDLLNETVLMTSHKLHVFRNRAALVKLAEYESKEYHRFLSVDIADVKGNGRSEIFVTCLNDNTKNLESFALEWDGSVFVTISDHLEWYLRVLEDPVRGRILAGQKRGNDVLFWGDVYRLIWDGRKYREQEKLPIPSIAMIYGIAMGNITDQSNEMIAVLDPNRKICIFTADGRQKWKSDKTYGGNENALFKLSGEDSESRIFFPHRLLVKDTNDDGKNDVIVVKNGSQAKRFFKKFRQNESGRITALTWDGFKLSPIWWTKQISGYISDYVLADMNNDGNTDLVVSVVSRRDSLLRSPKSAVILFELSTQRASK